MVKHAQHKPPKGGEKPMKGGSQHSQQDMHAQMEKKHAKIPMRASRGAGKHKESC